jgi:Eukaryotic translation initiation factor eIF2A
LNATTPTCCKSSLSQGLPASVRVYNVPKFDTPASQKNFFKGDKVQLKWNDNGTSLIVLAQTEVDKTGKSYYGETTMYLLSANGGFDSRIDLGMLLIFRIHRENLHSGRQGRTNPRRFVVSKVNQLCRCLRVHAGENGHFQRQSPSHAHFSAGASQHSLLFASW